ncbi:MAG: hypothetical protein QOG68_1998 [Solirubrobacteraceae bacterium]|nr:hypothetical protein [Solirubrobacteraceae bacterium]
MGGLAEHEYKALRVLTAPRLMGRALPWVGGAVGLKLVLELLDVHPLALNPLLSGLVAANVFLLGFLLAGTLADYKESERLPGELAGALDTIADECLIVHAEKGVPEGAGCLEHTADVADTIRRYLFNEHEFDHALSAVRGFNPYFQVFGPLIQPGFTTRLKSEQATVRRVLIRMEAIRSTTFVAAGYAIAGLTGVLLIAGLELTNLADQLVESLFFAGVITMLLTYVFLLIRDLDDPFSYPDGTEGVADVSLAPLTQVEKRLRAELAALRPSAAAPPAAPGAGT